MSNITILGDKILFRKAMWEEDEVFAARCFWFEFDTDTMTCTADMRVTFRKAMMEFISFCYPAFWNQPQYADEKKALLKDINDRYVVISKHINAVMRSRLPWYDMLFEHQKQGIASMYYRKFTMLSFEPRLGKSQTAASIAAVHNISRTVIVSYDIGKRNFLYDLTDPKWNGEEVVSKLNFTILDRQKRKSLEAFDEKFVVVNYESLKNFLQSIYEGGPVGLIIISECFPYNAIVETDAGPLKIGDIVENKMRVKALSADTQTGEISYKPIVDWLPRQRNTKFVRITTEDGSELICTSDHKIWVHDSGYTKAKEVGKGSYLVQMVQQASNGNKGNPEVLLKKMQQGLQDVFNGTLRKQKGISESKLQLVLKGVSNIRSSAKSFLRKKLFGKVEDEQARSIGLFKDSGVSQEMFSSVQQELRNESSVKRPASGEDEAKEPNGYAWRKREDDRVLERPNLSIVGEPANSVKMANNHSRVNSTSDGIQACPDKCSSFIPKLAGAILARLGVRRGEAVDRDRRRKPQGKEAAVYRQEKNCGTRLVRVDSVEVLEQGDRNGSGGVPSEDTVYDITVEGNHNYFANGILVSNCQKIKNHTSQIHKAVAKLISMYPDARIIFESGTPVMNRSNDMFAYFRLSRHPLGENYADFKRKFSEVDSRHGTVTASRNTDMLRFLSSNFVIRRTQLECTDMPRHNYINMYFEMGEWQGQYREAIYESMRASGKMAVESAIHSINRIMAMAKVEGMIETIECMVEADQKVVVFFGYKDPIKKMAKHFGDACVVIEGDTKDKMKEAIRFKEDPTCMIAICNTKAAGHTIDLSVSSNLFVGNFPLSPKELEQATDRIKNLSKHHACNVHFCISMGSDKKETVDERLRELIGGKDADINALIDGKEAQGFQDDIAEVLWKELTEQYKNMVDEEGVATVVAEDTGE